MKYRKQFFYLFFFLINIHFYVFTNKIKKNQKCLDKKKIDIKYNSFRVSFVNFSSFLLIILSIINYIISINKIISYIPFISGIYSFTLFLILYLQNYYYYKINIILKESKSYICLKIKNPYIYRLISNYSFKVYFIYVIIIYLCLLHI